MRTAHDAWHRCAQNVDHLARNSPFSPVFAEVVCTLGTAPTKAALGLPPKGGNGVIRDPIRRRHAASQLLMLQNPHRHRHEGRRRDRRRRPRRPWVAGPGRTSSRRGSPSAHPAPQVWRAPEGPEGMAAVPVGGGGAWPGFEPTRRAKLAARTASGRAAAHGRTEQPGPKRRTQRQEHPWGHKQTSDNQRYAATRSVL